MSKQLRDMQLVEMESLRKQMEDARRAHRRELGRVERRAEDAEARAVEARVEQEQRVHSLEARLQELSETVGTYDRIRQHDLVPMGHCPLFGFKIFTCFTSRHIRPRSRSFERRFSRSDTTERLHSPGHLRFLPR